MYIQAYKNRCAYQAYQNETNTYLLSSAKEKNNNVSACSTIQYGLLPSSQSLYNFWWGQRKHLERSSDIPLYMNYHASCSYSRNFHPSPTIKRIHHFNHPAVSPGVSSPSPPTSWESELSPSLGIAWAPESETSIVTGAAGGAASGGAAGGDGPGAAKERMNFT